MSLSPPEKLCSTVDNALAPHSDQERIFPLRWEPPEITHRLNSSSTVNEGQNNEDTCVLTVPLWVLKKCARPNGLIGELLLVLSAFSCLAVFFNLILSFIVDVDQCQYTLLDKKMVLGVIKPKRSNVRQKLPYASLATAVIKVCQ